MPEAQRYPHLKLPVISLSFRSRKEEFHMLSFRAHLMGLRAGAGLWLCVLASLLSHLGLAGQQSRATLRVAGHAVLS